MDEWAILSHLNKGISHMQQAKKMQGVRDWN
jgi:hypothetical protein